MHKVRNRWRRPCARGTVCRQQSSQSSEPMKQRDGARMDEVQHEHERSKARQPIGGHGGVQSTMCPEWRQSVRMDEI